MFGESWLVAFRYLQNDKNNYVIYKRELKMGRLRVHYSDASFSVTITFNSLRISRTIDIHRYLRVDPSLI